MGGGVCYIHATGNIFPWNWSYQEHQVACIFPVSVWQMYCASWCFQKVQCRQSSLLPPSPGPRGSGSGAVGRTERPWGTQIALHLSRWLPIAVHCLWVPLHVRKWVPALDQPWFESQKTSSDWSVLFPRGFQEAWRKLCLLYRVLLPLNASVCFPKALLWFWEFL